MSSLIFLVISLHYFKDRMQILLVSLKNTGL